MSIEQTALQALHRRVENQIGPHRDIRAPADDALRERVVDERDVHEPAAGYDAREVRDLQLTETIDVKRPLHRVLRVFRRGVGDCRALALAANDATQAFSGHQSGGRASCHHLAVA